MWYSIGDIAEVLGITTSALRFLESESIIYPSKDENGRRFYDIEDIFRLLSYTKYKNMKIPLKQIGQQFSGIEGDYVLIRQRLERARQNAQEKADYYAQLAQTIDERLKNIALIESLLDRYEFAKSPSWLLFSDSTSGWVSNSKSIRKKISRWVEAMPHVCLGAMMPQPGGAAQLGYFVSPEKATRLNLPLDDSVRQLDSTSCLHTIRKADKKFAQNPHKIFEESLCYAARRGLQIRENIVCTILLVEVEQGKALHTYVDLWIPIS
ncbi:MAG TPA: MerR family transcriptional regulator [Clostridia bacterium]|nr:MerR family transcriptional regulator [Clostridia bacterium]